MRLSSPSRKDVDPICILRKFVFKSAPTSASTVGGTSGVDDASRLGKEDADEDDDDDDDDDEADGADGFWRNWRKCASTPVEEDEAAPALSADDIVVEGRGKRREGECGG